MIARATLCLGFGRFVSGLIFRRLTVLHATGRFIDPRRQRHRGPHGFAGAPVNAPMRTRRPCESVAGTRERTRLYGSHDLYAVTKRQISHREAVRFGVT